MHRQSKAKSPQHSSRSSAGSAASARGGTPSVRVGYVNVNGLDQLKWAACLKLLHTSFDFLFLAETWFVGHERHVRDRRFVASTPLPPPSLQRTRNGGGIYLLASASARGRLVGDVRTTPSTITFDADALSFSAVYLQPSMSREDVVATLGSVAASHVVLGDVNARLPWLRTQLGRPGPPERVEALSDFARSHSFVTLEASEPDDPPQSDLPAKVVLRKLLTLDHCFVKSGRAAGARLLLLDNQSIGLPTDHAYTLYLHLSVHQSTLSCQGDAPAAIRFHLGKLSDEAVRRDMCAAFDEGTRSRGLLSAALTDAATLERRLIALVQSICRRFLGQKRSSTAAGVSRKKVPADRQDPQVSTLLYKSAADESRENGDILPSERGRSAGFSALQEISDSLAERYAGRALLSDESVDGIGADQSRDELSESHVVREIRRQDASKTCGLDGVHMRVIKALLPSCYPKVLCRLFNLCLASGTTPATWNSTDVHMVTKDTNRPRDVDNVRPIALICMHRKLFERLLLVHFFDKSGWAKLHPTQAGFRGDYSTLTNAAVVHHLLSAGLIRYAAFIDLEKAFDMVDHTRLRTLLARRGCPGRIRGLIESLTFRGLRSRVLVNGQSSDWFSRTRGVLQGSPLSPYLFNIYIDELVVRLNDSHDSHDSTAGIPQSLFYADDGVLLAQDLPSLRSLADVLTDWSPGAGIAVNVKKCGLVLGRTALFDSTFEPVLICGKALPIVDCYNYLGFPVKSNGIDFFEYIRKRIAQANGRASFLRLHSDAWGPAHRLRIYGRYLAPMFEYGAPLVFAWSRQSESNKKAFRDATAGWKDLIGWILDCSPDGSAAGANLCGILEPELRFRHLHTSFQTLLNLAPPDSPLNSCLASRPFLPRAPVGRPFLDSLRDAPDWAPVAGQGRPPSSSRRLLRLHLRRARRFEVIRSCLSRHLTRLTAHSRSTTALYAADGVFLAPLKYQQDFVRYRMGRFQLGKLCVCAPNLMFRRGHEICRHLPRLPRLSGNECRQKNEMAKRLGVGICSSFTDLDFLLNTRQYHRAGRALVAIRRALSDVYSERMQLENGPILVELAESSEAPRPRDLTPSDGTN